MLSSAGAEADLFTAWTRYEERLPGWGTASRSKSGRPWPEWLSCSDPLRFTLANSGGRWCIALSTGFSSASMAHESSSRPFWTCEDPPKIPEQLNL